MVVTSSWDDGTEEDIRLAEMLDKYDIEAIFYFPFYGHLCNERVGRNSLTPEARQAIAQRFEIGSHTLTHPLLTRVPLHVAEVEIINSQLALEDEFKKEVKSFCYPRGYANEDIKKIVGEHYQTARNTGVGNYMPSEDPLWQTPTVHAGGKRRPEYKGKRWLDEARRLLDEAIKTEGSVYHIFGHSWELTREDGWHDLDTLLKEIHERTRP